MCNVESEFWWELWGLGGSELEGAGSEWPQAEPGKEGNLFSKCQQLLLSKVR